MEAQKLENVAVFTDANILQLPSMSTLIQSLETHNILYEIFSDVRVEPNDVSFQKAISFLQNYNGVQAVVALGGGSVIDTAKAANLYTCYPPNDFYDYVNPPVGKGLPVPGPVLPLFAIPTTAGTGSETTGVAIFDDTSTKSKTGIASRLLKPTLGIVDPMHQATVPATVAKYAGLDVLCHAIESYTALPFTERPKPTHSTLRPAYQGSNPISDLWSLHALQTCVKYIVPAIEDGDPYAQSQMLLASTAAGIGFGNAGVHLCHGMSYSVASQVKSHREPEYKTIDDHPLIPHGLSVVVNAPAVFRFTGPACPQRHFECATILARRKGKNLTLTDQNKSEAGKILADEIMELMQDLNVPLDLESLGYGIDDVEALVQGTLPQHRVTKLSPRPVGEEELRALFLDALKA